MAPNFIGERVSAARPVETAESMKRMGPALRSWKSVFGSLEKFTTATAKLSGSTSAASMPIPPRGLASAYAILTAWPFSS